MAVALYNTTCSVGNFAGLFQFEKLSKIHGEPTESTQEPDQSKCPTELGGGQFSQLALVLIGPAEYAQISNTKREDTTPPPAQTQNPAPEANVVAFHRNNNAKYEEFMEKMLTKLEQLEECGNGPNGRHNNSSRGDNSYFQVQHQCTQGQGL